MTSRRKRWLSVVVVGVALASWIASPTVAALAFVLDVAGVQNVWRRLIPVRSRAFDVDDRLVPTRHGPVAVRVYRPTPPTGPTAVIVPGVHGGGVDEARLSRFCGRLAMTGVTAVCAPLPELRQFLITARSTDQIEDVTRWAADDIAPPEDGRVALVGVSFAGGLALVAAGRPALVNRVSVVVSIGGHGDLARTLLYLCTGRLPDGSTRAPHDYGLAVVTYSAVGRLVPSEQAAGLEHGIRTFLEASLDDSPGQPMGARLLAQARAEAAALPEPARSILTAVTERNRTALAPLIEPLIEVLTADPALSPERSAAPTAPVFLLHGLDDNVIPSTETPLIAAAYERQGHHDVRWLLTPLITHAHLRTSPAPRDAWRLVRFWEALFAALR